MKDGWLNWYEVSYKVESYLDSNRIFVVYCLLLCAHLLLGPGSYSRGGEWCVVPEPILAAGRMLCWAWMRGREVDNVRVVANLRQLLRLWLRWFVVYGGREAADIVKFPFRLSIVLSAQKMLLKVPMIWRSNSIWFYIRMQCNDFKLSSCPMRDFCWVGFPWCRGEGGKNGEEGLLSF